MPVRPLNLRRIGIRLRCEFPVSMVARGLDADSRPFPHFAATPGEATVLTAVVVQEGRTPGVDTTAVQVGRYRMQNDIR